MTRPSEDELIARYLAPLAGPGGLGLKDDAALLVPTPGHDLVLTVDAIVEGVHFLPDDPPETLAFKALGVNLSDLAAKGAVPAGFLMALALPDGWTEEWLAAFCGGLGSVAQESGCPLLGGDTTRAAGPLTISITAIGEVPSGTMVRRTTARPGDLVCVTGTIGDAALGLSVLTGAPWAASLAEAARANLADRYRRPRPRLVLAEAVRAHASAAMDVSDGLAGDFAKLLRASGMTGTLHLDRIPLSAAAKAALALPGPASTNRSAGAGPLLDTVVGGGDDYEILFTLPPDRLDGMTRDATALGLPITIVGEVREGEGLPDLRLDGSPYVLTSSSFQHFRDA